MTQQSITIWHCDANGCKQSAPEQADGWTSAIYTHGCPEHGAEIEAHAATITDQTRGRGRSEKTTWFIKCACGWRGGYETWSTGNLTMRHLLHVKESTAKRLLRSTREAEAKVITDLIEGLD